MKPTQVNGIRCQRCGGRFKRFSSFDSHSCGIGGIDD